VNDLATWYAGNDRYLRLSLTWLRLRLERATALVQERDRAERSAERVEAGTRPPALPEATPPPVAPVKRGWFRRLFETPQPLPGDPQAQPELDAGGATAKRLALPADELSQNYSRDWDDEIAAAAAEVREVVSTMSPPPGLERIGQVLGLSDFERDVLLLCVAPELDTGMNALFVGAFGQQWPTFASALNLFDDPAWDVRSPDRPLRYWHLLDMPSAPDTPLNSTPLRADERIVNAIKGLDHVDGRLVHLFEPVPAAQTMLPASQQAVVADAIDLWFRVAAGQKSFLVQLVGRNGPARTAVARQIATSIGRDLYRLRPALLPASTEEIDLLARLWQRETLIAPFGLYVEDDADSGASTSARGAFLSRTGGLILLGGHDVFPDAPGAAAVLDVATPTGAEQRALWREVLGPTSDVDVGPLVEQFNLDADMIRRIARDAGPLPDGPLATVVLRSVARKHLRPRLESAAVRVEPMASWDSLILPDAETALLHQIAEQVTQRSRVYRDWGFGARMNRGLGISALFAGESGTGKTMAAEVLANELGLDLFRIDLAGVVSKYIGETEKNLRGLFDAAEEGGVILFFDEADALFGKRSEVKDAHDRYANIEINYLLQRLETYRGLAILATNMRGALDRAFIRRLRFVVTFPFPSVADRARMWQLAFPSAVPCEPLDVLRLARIDLTGAGIANAALNAAFRAAHAERPVGMACVLAAARGELRKQDRPVNEADFRWESGALA